MSVFKNKSSTQLERMKKNLKKTFKDFGLEIVAESNLKIVNYLDVTLNLNNSSFNLTTNQMILFSTLTKNLTTLLELLNTYQHVLKNGFQTILPMKAIYYEDTLNKAGYINNLVYHTPSTSNQENKNKGTSGMLYGLTHHTVKVSQQE